jgi:N utilization substance protein B
MKRRRAREYALQILFQHDFSEARPDTEEFWRESGEDEKTIGFANDLVSGTLDNIKEIDAAILKAAEHWNLERMAVVDRNILRAATYELLFRDDVPEAVTINEAIEIAKKYSSVDSAAFINGILDRIAKTRPGT